MRKTVVGNWKQNMTLVDMEAWAAEFIGLVTDSPVSNVDMIVAASFPYLAKLTELCAAIPNFYVSAQDVSQFDDGRHTGKVSALQLNDFVKYCIVGHSETGDTRETAMKKAELCMAEGIIPIFCFSGTGNVPAFDEDKALLVWEDPENISTVEGGYTPKTADSIGEGISKIGRPVLYGGSVNRQNASELSKIDGLVGVLPGNASLEAKHFFDIISAFDKP